jgi:hypothetical protein
MMITGDVEKGALNSNEVSGNVRISILPNELIVTIPATRVNSSAILSALLIAFFLYKLMDVVRALVIGHPGSGGLIASAFVLPFVLWIVFQLSRGLFGHREVLRCTGDRLEITEFDFGHAWRRRSFARGDIKQIEFAAVGFSKYGAVTGLRFSASGKQIKCLRNLLSVEANKILSELRNLGFNTTVDPAMPMMMEIEESRRKSFWGMLGR